MRSSDVMRAQESKEEAALRDELRGLLGLPLQPEQELLEDVTIDPGLAALAERLRAEASRRKRLDRGQSGRWMLLAAAALPVLLTIGVAGAWGLHQKQRADILAADLQQRDERHRSELASINKRLEAERRSAVQTITPRTPAPKDRKTAPTPGGPELVIPVGQPAISPSTEVETVKHHIDKKP